MDENFNINPDIVDRHEVAAARDPFADEWGGVAYVDEAGKLNINKLLHLAPYSEVLLVSGPLGVGKSTLLHQFVVGAKKTWKVIHIHASSLMTTEEFLRQVVHGFGLPSAGVDDIEDMLIEIGRYLKALGRSGRRAIVVIDDAHLLADDVVVMVEHILGDEHSTNAISLVLGVDDGAAISRLDNFPLLLHKLAYTLRLAPMSEADVVGYIHHRLAHSGNRAAETIFDAALIKQLYIKSGGLPGKLNELARRHLNGGAATVTGRNLVRWGLGLVGVAVIGGILLFQDRINQLVSTPPKSPAAVAESAVAIVDEMADESAPAEVIAEASVDNSVEVVADVSAPPVVMGELDDQAENQAEAAVAEVVVAGIEQAESTPDAAIATLPKPTEPPVIASAPLPKPVAPARVVVEPPAPPLAKSVVKASEKSKEKANVGKSWLQSQNPEYFTLQLMALLDESQVRQHMKKHKLQGQSEIFTVTRKGKQLSVLVYGSYPDRAAADEAAKSLPKTWGVKSPWVRTFASVFEDIGLK